MKILYYSIMVLSFFSLFISSGCKETPPSPLTERTTLLKNEGNPWTLINVSKDGFDVTSDFTGFTITFSESTYTTTNSLNTAWAASGTWAYKNDNPDIIVREDGIEVTVATGNNQLVLSFLSSGPVGGRVEGVGGDYVFTLGK